jgi:SPP1 gp7 family putative phage head morphogenesis protein
MSLEDSLIRRQILAQRLASGQAIEAQNILQRIYNDVSKSLTREPTEFRADRLRRLRDDIDVILNQGFTELDEKILDGVLLYANDEADFTHQAINLETNVELSLPAPAQIEQAVLQRGMAAPIGPTQITMQQALNQFSEKKSREIRTMISDGILEGLTTPEVAKNVEGMTDRPKAQVNALVRTTINHAGSQARRAVVVENQSLFKGEEWVSTLDSRTSLICAGRDGRIYPVNKGEFPPAHWNCRSVRVPVLKSEFDIDPDAGKRPQKGAKGAGQTSAKTKFDGWLRSQPASFQDEYFSQFADGKEKSKLFRAGKLDIQFFRDETGKNYTLEQLHALNPLAFEKANIKI